MPRGTKPWLETSGNGRFPGPAYERNRKQTALATLETDRSPLLSWVKSYRNFVHCTLEYGTTFVHVLLREGNLLGLIRCKTYRIIHGMSIIDNVFFFLYIFNREQIQKVIILTINFTQVLKYLQFECISSYKLLTIHRGMEVEMDSNIKNFPAF